MANDVLWGTGKAPEDVARALVGKTIAYVDFEYVNSSEGVRLSLETLTFTDGTRAWIAVEPGKGEVCVDLVYPVPDAKIGGQPAPGAGPQ